MTLREENVKRCPEIEAAIKANYPSPDKVNEIFGAGENMLGRYFASEIPFHWLLLS